MKRNFGQEPFILRLVTLLAADKAEESEATPFSNRTIAILMAIAGVGAFLYGTIAGVIPW